MNCWNDTNWFAVQTKPHREDLAAAHVARLDLTVFLPKAECERPVCGALRPVRQALFPGYFFVRFRPVPSLDAVRYAPGVLRVVGTRLHPIPVASGIVAEIRERVAPDGFVRLDTASFHRGDRVVIEQGPLAGWMGRVERESDDGKRVLILLDAIRQASALVEKRRLTPSLPKG